MNFAGFEKSKKSLQTMSTFYLYRNPITTGHFMKHRPQKQKTILQLVIITQRSDSKMYQQETLFNHDFSKMYQQETLFKHDSSKMYQQETLFNHDFSKMYQQKTLFNQDYCSISFI